MLGLDCALLLTCFARLPPTSTDTSPKPERELARCGETAACQAWLSGPRPGSTPRRTVQGSAPSKAWAGGAGSTFNTMSAGRANRRCKGTRRFELIHAASVHGFTLSKGRAGGMPIPAHHRHTLIHHALDRDGSASSLQRAARRHGGDHAPGPCRAQLRSRSSSRGGGLGGREGACVMSSLARDGSILRVTGAGNVSCSIELDPSPALTPSLPEFYLG